MNRIAHIPLDMGFYLTFPKFEHRNLDVSNTVVYIAYKVYEHYRRSESEILGDHRKTT